ncbi:winged helix-turn-helix domain-containing protein [Enterobacter cloacae]|uniref:winged helix-turn-helix domain-containing protein n=1 Tax=Enterobacter cloacae TaxID=550 RepID=UPI0013D0856D|nr:winged helix-turn-helix domain-containing protein [Enterobacter cloacae]
MRFLIVSESAIYSHHIASLLHEDGHVVDIQGQCLTPAPGIGAYLKDYPVSGVVLDLRAEFEESACRLYVEWKKICGVETDILPVVQSVRQSVGLLNSGAMGAHEDSSNARLLLARLYALVRRRQSIYSDIVFIKPLEIDLVTKRVYYKGRDLLLTPFEYKIMEALLRNRERVVRRDELILNLYSEAPQNEKTRSLEVIVGRLRCKLRQCIHMNNGGIEVIRSVGYRFAICSDVTGCNRELYRRGRASNIGTHMAIRAGWRWFS